MENLEISPLDARRAEVAQYEANIALYKTILLSLPTEYPGHLIQYKNAANKHDVVASVENIQDVELLSKLWYADECIKFIRTETLEMTKAKSILSVLEATQNL